MTISNSLLTIIGMIQIRSDGIERVHPMFNLTGITLEKDPRSQKCPACGNENLERGSAAIVSPWIVELAGEKKLPAPKYKICVQCETSWFNRSYTEEVLDSLYKTYRGDKYFKVRNSWEPTYTRKLNSGLNNGQEWLEGRRTQILRSLDDAGAETSKMKSVLDFGGGHGGVMPKFSQRYLLEANETATPEAGIELIRAWQDAKKLSLDLVMCCGVLEHLNDPTSLIETILELDARIYLFEVPTGIPEKRRGLASSFLFLKILASNRSFWRAVQIIERRSGRTWRHYFPLRCSEHLQFFSKRGLIQLLEKCGLEVIGIRETKPNESLTDKQNLGFESGLIAVCRRKKD